MGKNIGIWVRKQEGDEYSKDKHRNAMSETWDRNRKQE